MLGKNVENEKAILYVSKRGQRLEGEIYGSRRKGWTRKRKKVLERWLHEDK